MMNMYSYQYTLPDSDDDDEDENGLENGLKSPEMNKDKYSKLDDVKEVDNKLEVEDDKKDGADKDKTQDMSNRSADKLFKNDGNDDKKEEAKIDIPNAPTNVTQKKNAKVKKDKPKGVGFDTVFSR